MQGFTRGSLLTMGNSSSTCLYNCLDGECPHKYYKKRNSDTKQQVPSHCIQPASQQISGKGFLAVKMYNNSASTGGGGGGPHRKPSAGVSNPSPTSKGSTRTLLWFGEMTVTSLGKSSSKAKGKHLPVTAEPPRWYWCCRSKGFSLTMSHLKPHNSLSFSKAE